MRNLLLIIVAALAGGAAGVCGSLVLRTPASAVPASAPTEIGAPSATADRRVASLERKLLAVEQQLREEQLHAQEPRAQEPVPEIEDLPELRAEHQRQAEAEHNAALARHRLESRDARWANEREQTLTEQLARTAAKIDVEVLNVDCRTQSCVARLRWPDRDVARARLIALLDETAQVGCARRVQFPQTGAVPYEAELYLECPHAQ